MGVGIRPWTAGNSVQVFCGSRRFLLASRRVYEVGERQDLDHARPARPSRPVGERQDLDHGAAGMPRPLGRVALTGAAPPVGLSRYL